MEYAAMPDETAPETDGQAAEAKEPQGSVFGNLPRTRPGTRSPRREAPVTSAAAPSGSRGDRAEPRGEETDQRAGPADPNELPPEADEGGGFEDLAWAGVAAAAEAATLGVRLANRALEAVKDAVERR